MSNGKDVYEMRIGIISDTHIGGAGDDLPAGVRASFQGVDLILHCGDLDNSTGVLDYLAEICPVKAVRGYSDPKEDGDRLAETTRVIRVGEFNIGMIHDIEWPGPHIRFRGNLKFPPGDIGEILMRKFSQVVDIVVFGDTHEEYIGVYQGVLFINPGSPTWPGIRHQPGDPGTIAILDIEDGVFSVNLIQL